jgi:hypothetical protein
MPTFFFVVEAQANLQHAKIAQVLQRTCYGLLISGEFGFFYLFYIK